MATLVMDPQPTEVEELIARREALGLDHRDEVCSAHEAPPVVAA